MLDTEPLQQRRRDYANTTREQEHGLNSFDGEFAITAHELIPRPLRQFIQLSFGSARITRIPIEDINDLLNSVWEGAGSLSRIFELEQMLMNSTVNFAPNDLPKKSARRADK